MTKTEIEISNSDDLIDSRDVIARIEELEETIAADDDEQSDGRADAVEELEKLTAFMAEMRGNGGDEEWRDDWYPVTIIRDSYFEDYARELAEDIGAIPDDAKWPCTCIDWEKAAGELQQDYTSVDFDGVTYWVR